MRRNNVLVLISLIYCKIVLTFKYFCPNFFYFLFEFYSTFRIRFCFIIRLFPSNVNGAFAILRILRRLPFFKGHIGWNVVSFSGLDISCPPLPDSLQVFVIRCVAAPTVRMKRRCVLADLPLALRKDLAVHLAAKDRRTKFP